MDFTIVTAVNPEYLTKLKWTLPTWYIKPQFNNKPICIFYNSLKESDLDFVKLYFKDVTLINWTMPKYDSIRELMLSSFVYAAEHVKTPYYCKIDADVVFTSDQDVFEDDDLNFDLVSHKWGYTKPGYWLGQLKNYFNKTEDLIDLTLERFNHPRIISFCCLHKTEFVLDVISKVGRRLPVPSHDTLLWYCAENFEGRKWKVKNVKDRGVEQKNTFRGIREVVCSKGLSNPFLKTSLFDNVQLEITTKCNLGCFNCDRNCGVAPSDERMSVQQVAQFVAESIELKHAWRRIDIIGGEPTMHPDLMQIIDLMKLYITYYPNCRIRLSTNGIGEACKNTLARLPKFVDIRNSEKTSKSNAFDAYNSAPIDNGEKESKSCSIPWRCGLGLTRYGYFPCGAGASLCRVFGFDIGAKSLKEFNMDKFESQIKDICKYCGHSNVDSKHISVTQEMSPSWKTAVSTFKDKKLSEI